MPSNEHDSPIAPTWMNTDLMAWLLRNIFELEVPDDYDHARPHATDVRVMAPRTYRADNTVLFCNAADQPLLATVLEVQHGWDLTKKHTWTHQVAQLEAELDVDAALLVHCPDPAIAHRYRALFEVDGLCLSFRPLIFSPEDVPAAARTGWEAFMTTAADYEFQSELLRELAAK